MFPSSENERTHNLTDTPGEQGVHGESNDRRSERRGKARATDRSQQMPPAFHAKQVSDERQRDAGKKEIPSRANHLRPHPAEVGVPQKERHQPNREKKDEESTDVACHLGVIVAMGGTHCTTATHTAGGAGRVREKLLVAIISVLRWDQRTVKLCLVLLPTREVRSCQRRRRS